MEPVTPEQRAVIRSQIEELIAEYGYRFDHGQADRMADLFTPDAVFRGLAGPATGTAELHTIFTKTAKFMAATRHVCTNLHLVIETPERARGTVVFTSYGHRGEGMGKPEPHTVGDMEDLYVKGPDGRWRFAERKINAVFSSWVKK